MRNDDRRIIQAKTTDGVVSPIDLNTALRQLSEMIYKQEGRKGPLELRDSLRVIADSDQTVFRGTSAQSGQVEMAFRGTLGEELEIGQGTRHDFDTRFATVPNPTSIRFRPGQIDIQADVSLTVGQAYVPTVVQSFFAEQPQARICCPAGDQSVTPQDTDQLIIFGDATFNLGSLWSIATPNRLTITKPGLYLFGYAVEWTGVAATRQSRRSYMCLDGSTTVRYGQQGVQHTENDIGVLASGSALARLTAGQFIELYVNSHDAGATASVLGIADTSPVLWATWIAA